MIQLQAFARLFMKDAPVAGLSLMNPPSKVLFEYNALDLMNFIREVENPKWFLHVAYVQNYNDEAVYSMIQITRESDEIINALFNDKKYTIGIYEDSEFELLNMETKACEYRFKLLS